MPRNGSGIFTFPPSSWNPPVNGANATAADWLNLLNDLASAISLSVASDGQTPMTGPLNMGGNRINNLGAPIGQNQALRWQQLAEGPNIASASTITIPNEGGLFLVTGTTTIEELSGSYIGRRATLIFGDELTIRSSPQLIIPGGVDYTTEPGDILEFIRISATAWSMLSGSGGGAIGGPGRTMVIQATGNIVLPSNRIWVTACGAGGNGGPNTGGGSPGAGGGGGAVFIRREFSVSRGSTVMATMGAPGGAATSLAGVFALNSGQNGTSSPGSGGAASSQGSGGIAAPGGNGGGRGLAANGPGGSGGGSLGGGGAGGASSDNTICGYPGTVQYGTSPGPGIINATRYIGGFGIGTLWAGAGEPTDRLSNQAGKGGFGAGGGGAGGATSDLPGAGGDPIIIIEW